MPTKDELTQQYVAMLKDEGYQPKLDADGDIEFQFEGNNYYFVISEKDPEFLQLLRVGLGFVTEQKSREDALRACNVVNNTVKVGKAYILKDGYVRASAEVFAPTSDTVKPILHRLLIGVQRVATKYAEEIHAGSQLAK